MAVRPRRQGEPRPWGCLCSDVEFGHFPTGTGEHQGGVLTVGWTLTSRTQSHRASHRPPSRSQPRQCSPSAVVPLKTLFIPSSKKPPLTCFRLATALYGPLSFSIRKLILDHYCVFPLLSVPTPPPGLRALGQ